MLEVDQLHAHPASVRLEPQRLELS